MVEGYLQSKYQQDPKIPKHNKGFELLMNLQLMLNHIFKLSVFRTILLPIGLFSLIFTSGCSLMVSSATSNMMEHLSNTILNSDDLATVKDGAPAYLLMVDSMINKDPGNEEMLATAATLYTAYADVFVTDELRSKKMAQKALDYAIRAICISNKKGCNLKTMPYDQFESTILGMQKRQVPTLFSLGDAWASWIIANKNDFNAIADLSYIELIMHQVVKIDETYKNGAAFLYLGTMATFLPPALGGKPEEGKKYFETAIRLSNGNNFMAKVLYAKFYARMMFDRTLHDQLLMDVIESDPHIPGYTLVNTYAQQQAHELLKSANEYF